TLQRHAVSVFVSDEFGRPPVELRSLRISVTHSLQLTEVSVRNPQVRKLIKTRGGQHQHVRITRLGWISEVLRSHQQFLWPFVTVDLISKESTVVSIFVVGL